MKKLFIKVTIVLLLFTMLLNCTYTSSYSPFIVTAEAHSGRTDSSGGHRDNRNKSGLGYYHYHCGGHPAHLHKNGTCPYKKTATNKKVSSKKQTVYKKKNTISSSTVIKKMQKKLNTLGYNCGKVDGKLGDKTKKALMKYQKDHKLKVDGKIGPQVKKALRL